MENLLAIVEKIQQVSPLGVFSQDVFIVQNAGMQHWLNMSLANKRGISLNIDYALPAQYLWKLLRNLVNGGGELEQTPFSREALCWRIYQLLADTSLVDNQAFTAVNRYWQSTAGEFNHAADISEQQNLKRYQLACQVADLYEQYLIFRPEWIAAWHNNELIEEQGANADFYLTQKWQALLWQRLVQQQEYNPVKLINQAIANLASAQHYFPKRLSFFGINAMAPMWLSFIHALSEHTEVHFFHLNPCFTYWGDIVSEKQAIKLLSQWTNDYQELSDTVGNPLLANLGQQGREFLALLQQYSCFNIDAFSSQPEEEANSHLSVLAQIQQDILSLTDARQTPQKQIDDSIVITSAHSTLREVQGLHDWLLHQFNQDKELTPKDVLVMCPQVEQYAPYVNAVFAQGWQELDSKIPPLPCSIADRISKESDPLVAAFSELLTLPDSRFQVSQILSWLRVPAMLQKFALTIEDLEKVTVWLEHACVHWGLNQRHKQQVLNSEVSSAQFTWHYGFSRLLEGFAYASSTEVYQGKLVLPDVEGNDAILLGKLMLVIEQLQYFTLALNQHRTPAQWQAFLTELVEELFASSQAEDFHMIYQALEHLVEYCCHADFSEKISLAIVKDFLDSHFSQPDPGRQFMVGQVTFCSMLPMRSIPFKIIAILGLNDGEFPRQRQPLGFDLMSLSTVRAGDRSRRGDDRYLFLEAIISARDNLYLSYQGRNIRNNNLKQPSIVLKELMEYLSLAYGWRVTEDEAQDIRQLAMQPYSEQNYQGKFASFDSKWLKIQQNRMAVYAELNTSAANIRLTEVQNIESELNLTVGDLLSFFQHPARYFARQALSLYFEQQQSQLSDSEPFDCDHLTSYLYKQALLAQLIAEKIDTSTVNEALISHSQRAMLSGKFPDLPHNEQLLDKLNQDTCNLYQYFEQDITGQATRIPISVSLTVNEQLVTLSTQVKVVGEQLVYYRPSSIKAKDLMRQYLDLLIVQLWQMQDNRNESSLAILEQVTSSHGYYFDTKNQQPVHYCYQGQQAPEQQLMTFVYYFILGQNQPLLLNGELATKYFKAKVFEQSQFEQFWHEDYYATAFGDDPYIRYFWQQCPNLSDILPALEQVYQGMFANVTQVKS
ncbi:RecBCD enzyme subunit RecC [Thalassotalea insulae]|uniref:RecBCD enzyme subunit RecC n=2 Tax=Thalassotalea insulae TaxID=2056778 RepID=A0ABQ6H124_9GAMM|nr:RecBCD enzyme subunit RecC [Thalassotalea insulae]